MNNTSHPLVSIVTPVYNGAKYLADCIESVLRQSYEQWEYLIVSNRSTDATVEIAERYAARDSRIRVCSYTEFVDVIKSYNRALRLISPHTKYCKVVAADDALFPECISQTVRLAEENPSVAIVGAYTLRGGATNWRVVFDGLPCATSVVSGREACRWHLLGGTHYLGIPTSVLYRADLVRGTTHFLPNPREHADISAFYEYLRTADFGFVHQVLTYERVHEDALGARAKQFSTYLGSHLLDIYEYGRFYLDKVEMEKRLDAVLRDYYDLLAVGAIHLKDRRFWEYHKDILDQSGSPLSVTRLTMAVCMKLADLTLNPKQTLEKILLRMDSKGTMPVGSQSRRSI